MNGSTVEGKINRVSFGFTPGHDDGPESDERPYSVIVDVIVKVSIEYLIIYFCILLTKRLVSLLELKQFDQP